MGGINELDVTVTCAAESSVVDYDRIHSEIFH